MLGLNGGDRFLHAVAPCEKYVRYPVASFEWGLRRPVRTATGILWTAAPDEQSLGVLYRELEAGKKTGRQMDESRTNSGEEGEAGDRATERSVVGFQSRTEMLEAGNAN